MRVRGQIGDELAERLFAEAFEAGASGSAATEVAGAAADSEDEIVVYAPLAVAERVRVAIRSSAPAAIDVGPVEELEDVDWSERWRRGIAATVVSPRLVIRPPFVQHPLVAEQREVVIDPGQAFGTGGHASTQLALEWLDELAAVRTPERVLDVGTGSGVLALAALRLGAGTAVGFDLDPLAAPEARRAARANGLAHRLATFTGPIDALAPDVRFDLVLVNLLSSECLPLLVAIAARLEEGRGRAVFSGLLACEEVAVESALAAAGLRVLARRALCDERGDDWIALATSHPRRSSGPR